MHVVYQNAILQEGSPDRLEQKDVKTEGQGPGPAEDIPLSTLQQLAPDTPSSVEIKEPFHLWKNWTARQLFDEWEELMQYGDRDKEEVKRTLLRLEIKMFELNALHQARKIDTGREPENTVDINP